MVRKSQQREEPMTVAAPAISDYDSLFRKIDALQGKEKANFTKTLTLEEKRSYIKYCRSRDCEMVTGVFRCFEPLGGSLEMTGMAYDGEVPEKYTFLDGQTYTIPKYIAKRFENEFQGLGTWYPTHFYILDAMGKPIIGAPKKNRRFGFSSMEFQ